MLLIPRLPEFAVFQDDTLNVGSTGSSKLGLTFGTNEGLSSSRVQEKMKKRSAKASSKLPVPVSLLHFPSLSSHSPIRKSYNSSSVLHPSSRSMKKTKPPFLSPPSPLVHRQSPPQKAVARISDLKDLAASRLYSIKQQIDLSHAEILKGIDTAKSRLSKRFQMQLRACLHIAAEAEKENKKISDWINGNMDILKKLKRVHPVVVPLLNSALTVLDQYSRYPSLRSKGPRIKPSKNCAAATGLRIRQGNHATLGGLACRSERGRETAKYHLRFVERVKRSMESAPLVRPTATPLTSSLSSPLRKPISVFPSPQTICPPPTRLLRWRKPLLAVKSPKGFGPPANRTNEKRKRRGRDEVDGEDDDETYEGDNEDTIPEVVTNRMMRRMGFSVGTPLAIGLMFFPFFYYLKMVAKVDVPTWIPVIVSFFFFGTALLGVSYGIVSSSWDPLREGSFWGWTEARKNWPVFWQSLWGQKGK
ncbi:hypothetical protein ACLOJK_039908 [Asimina triloba]